ncbi:MAG: type II toxin-antitoxin system HicB family antitoxin [Ignavibacteriales bacterium]
MSPVSIKEYFYTVFFNRAPEGGYIVTVPALAEFAVETDDLEEAREITRHAVRDFLEDLIKNGETIPEEKAPPKENQSFFSECIGVQVFFPAPKAKSGSEGSAKD